MRFLHIYRWQYSRRRFFYRGISIQLFLIFRLRIIELTGLTKLHVIHVAGTRMIDQGTDGLSRGYCLKV